MRRTSVCVFAAAIFGLAASICQAAPAAPTWYRAETRHFVIYSDADEESTRTYLAKLESFYVTASSLYVTVSDSAIDYKQKPVFLYIRTLADDYTIFPYLKMPSSTQGTSINLYSQCVDGETNVYTDADFMSSYFDGDYRFLSPNLYLKRVYTSKGLPAWVSSGMYSYVLHADIQKDKIVVGNPSAWQTLDPGHGEKPVFLDQHVPFSEIIADNITSTKAHEALPAQYWLMMDYMLSTPELRQKLRQYVDLVTSGQPSSAAFKQAIGIEPAFFDQLIKDYNRHGFPVIEYKVAALDSKDLQLDKLPDYGVSVPLLSAAAQTCMGPQYAGAVLDGLQKAAATQPSDAYARRELARGQILLGHPLEAKAYIEAEGAKSANDYDFKYIEGRYYLALAEDGAGAERTANYQKARASLGTAYKLSETSGPVLYYYARAFEDQPDFPSANTVMAVRQANELLPGAGYENYLDGLLIKAGRIVDEYSQKIGEKPTVSAYIQRAYYRPESQTKEKLADYDAAMQLGPDSDSPYIARSAYYLAHDNVVAALDDANKALALDAHDFRALNARALVYLKIGKTGEAAGDLEKGIYENETVTAMNAACWALATHGYAERAIPFCNKAIAKSPIASNAVDSRAFAELRLNQLDAALADYNRALALSPHLPSSWYGRGEVETKMGKIAEGDRDRAHARTLYPAIDAAFAKDMDGIGD